MNLVLTTQVRTTLHCEIRDNFYQVLVLFAAQLAQLSLYPKDRSKEKI